MTDTAYIMIKWAFAPPDERLRQLVARENAMPATLAEARKNLDNPPRIYKAAPATVQETPPFLRATTSASMDIPGPFETVATEAYYNRTLPDPKASAKATREFMKQWYYAVLERLGTRRLAGPLSAVPLREAVSFRHPQGVRRADQQRRVGALLRADGHRRGISRRRSALPPRANPGRPASQRALIVGIRLHTKGMTVAQAEDLFVTEGYQPRPVAVSESKRGTSDPTYGYYTMGKLMIFKLREEYKAKMGAQYSLQKFHDTFIALGPLPLPLIRKAMLGEAGQLF